MSATSLFSASESLPWHTQELASSCGALTLPTLNLTNVPVVRTPRAGVGPRFSHRMLPKY